MQVVVVGLGVQGNKRRLNCGDEFYASIDPVWVLGCPIVARKELA